MLLVDWLVLEARKRGSDSVLLSHLEVLSEVLVSAPPVEPNVADSLVLQLLVEVGVSHVLLLSVSRESHVFMRRTLSSAHFSCRYVVLG